VPPSLRSRQLKVSFVIPLFNCLDLTKACLASLQATVPRGLDYEILLIDDGSTDGTREWLKTLGPPVRVLLNEQNLGYSASSNRGAREATGEILGLLNNDLVLLPGWLPPILRFFRLGRRPGFVGNIQMDASTGAMDHSGIYIQTNGKPAHRGVPEGIARFRRVQPAIAVTAACAFVRRDTFLQLGGFDEGFVNGGEDVDLCLRAREAGLRNWVVLASRVLHHVSASPGRKENDERNSWRLAARWRGTLAREAARTWCRRFVADNWHEPRALDPRLALHALLNAWEVTDSAPREARWMVELAMHREELRWEAMLGPAR